MEIHKATTPLLEALTKHNIHKVQVHQDGECYPQFNKS